MINSPLVGFGNSLILDKYSLMEVQSTTLRTTVSFVKQPFSSCATTVTIFSPKLDAVPVYVELEMLLFQTELSKEGGTLKLNSEPLQIIKESMLVRISTC